MYEGKGINLINWLKTTFNAQILNYFKNYTNRLNHLQKYKKLNTESDNDSKAYSHITN